MSLFFGSTHHLCTIFKIIIISLKHFSSWEYFLKCQISPNQSNSCTFILLPLYKQDQITTIISVRIFLHLSAAFPISWFSLLDIKIWQLEKPGTVISTYICREIDFYSIMGGFLWNPWVKLISIGGFPIEIKTKITCGYLNFMRLNYDNPNLKTHRAYLKYF